MSISKEFVVHLRGKDYPLYAGVLDAATKSGLRSLTTRVVQIPAPENGQLAVVTARAEFEDGRVFEDVGDCSPQSTAPHLASAALRLASTRAKGRVLRDSINVGQTMFEELPDLDEPLGHASSAPVPRGGQGMYVAEPRPAPLVERPRPVSPTPRAAEPPEREPMATATESRAEPLPADRPRAMPPERPVPVAPRASEATEKEAAVAVAERNGNGAGKLECTNVGCGKPLTKGQHDISQRAYGQPLCPTCQKQFPKVG